MTENKKRFGFTFTPQADLLVWKYGDIYLGLVYGKVARYCSMRKGYCFATSETIAEELGTNRTTVTEKLHFLEEAGYIVDKTPDVKNKPHKRIITMKLKDEQDELKEFISQQKEIDFSEDEDEIEVEGEPISFFEYYKLLFQQVLIEYRKLLLMNFSVSHVYTGVSQIDTSVSHVYSQCKPGLHEETNKETNQERREQTISKNPDSFNFEIEIQSEGECSLGEGASCAQSETSTESKTESQTEVQSETQSKSWLCTPSIGEAQSCANGFPTGINQPEVIDNYTKGETELQNEILNFYKREEFTPEQLEIIREFESRYTPENQKYLWNTVKDWKRLEEAFHFIKYEIFFVCKSDY